MSLPTSAVFKDKDDKILAYGFCNPGWPFSPNQYINLVQEALVNARIKYYILTGGEYDEKIFKTEENYEHTKESIERGKTLEELKEKNGEQYFSEDWFKKWHSVEVFDLKVWRDDLIRATKDPLYEEQFRVNLNLKYKQLLEMQRRKERRS